MILDRSSHWRGRVAWVVGVVVVDWMVVPYCAICYNLDSDLDGVLDLFGDRSLVSEGDFRTTNDQTAETGRKSHRNGTLRSMKN